jgi:hypothetical protein
MAIAIFKEGKRQWGRGRKREQRGTNGRDRDEARHRNELRARERERQMGETKDERKRGTPIDQTSFRMKGTVVVLSVIKCLLLIPREHVPAVQPPLRQDQREERRREELLREY